MGIAATKKSRQGTQIDYIAASIFPGRKPGEVKQLVDKAIEHYESICPSVQARVWASEVPDGFLIKTTSAKLSRLVNGNPDWETSRIHRFAKCDKCDDTGVESHRGELNHVCKECNGTKISPNSPMGQAIKEIGLEVVK